MKRVMADVIASLNLYVLTTLRNIAQEDIAQAILYFGVPEEVVETIKNLNDAEIYFLAQGPAFIFHLDHQQLHRLLESRSSLDGYGVAHTSITRIANLLSESDEHEG